jgi:hypothetical protein
MESVTRIFTVKTVGGGEEQIIVEPSLSFDGFKEKVRTAFGFDEDRRIKVVFSGGVVDATKFTDIPDKSVVICLATRPPRQVSTTTNNTEPESIPTTPVPIPPPSLPVQSLPVQSQPIESTTSANTPEPMYGFKNIKAYTIVFLNFIAANPQLRDAFLNNYGLLVTELAKNEQLEEVMKNILSQSGQILEAMEKGENIKLNINTDNNSMEQIELTEEDRARIDQLIAMGFNPDKAVVEYLKAGKDINRALDALQRS